MFFACVAITIVVPALLMSFKISMIPIAVSGSKLPVGSSAISSAGLFTIALARETLCCSPPDIS